jgi:hypothetical protein
LSCARLPPIDNEISAVATHAIANLETRMVSLPL